MNIYDIDWSDSQIKVITIEFDKVDMLIECDSKKYNIVCTGFVGLTNLCIWDDTIIESVDVSKVDLDSDPFLKQVYLNYDKFFDYNGRSLKDADFVLSIRLINNMSFSVYCQNINVI